MANETNVKKIQLECEIDGKPYIQEFDHKHAERIFKLQENQTEKGWTLVNPKLEYKDGHIIKRASAGATDSPAQG